MATGQDQLHHQSTSFHCLVILTIMWTMLKDEPYRLRTSMCVWRSAMPHQYTLNDDGPVMHALDNGHSDTGATPSQQPQESESTADLCRPSCDHHPPDRLM